MAYDLMGADGPIVGDDVMGELMGADEMGDDAMGDDVGDDLMGAARRARRRQAGRQMARASGVPTGRPALINKIAGISPPAIGRLPLGFGVLGCTAAVNPSGGQLVARPQVPWRGSKLILGISGVNAGNYAVAFRPTIGNKPVLAGAGSIDARSFPSTGIDNNLISDSAAVGIDVTLDFVITPAITGGDTVNVQATWIGDATV